MQVWARRSATERSITGIPFNMANLLTADGGTDCFVPLTLLFSSTINRLPELTKGGGGGGEHYWQSQGVIWKVLVCSPSAAPLRKMKLGTTAQQQYHQKASSLSACPPKGPRVPCQINQQDTNAFDPLLESKMSNLLKEQDQGKGSSNLSMIIIFTSTVLVFGFFF